MYRAGCMLSQLDSAAASSVRGADNARPDTKNQKSSVKIIVCCKRNDKNVEPPPSLMEIWQNKKTNSRSLTNKYHKVIAALRFSVNCVNLIDLICYQFVMVIETMIIYFMFHLADDWTVSNSLSVQRYINVISTFIPSLTSTNIRIKPISKR
uniref:Uncharacterized protein n=1 Tax=Glossina brevipalpis TaxID=37001 RepID=A0A1A9WYT3_9MUSC